MREDPNRFKKINDKIKKFEEELMLKIEVYLVEKEINYDDCIFENFIENNKKNIDDDNKCIIEFTCIKNDKLLKGESYFERENEKSDFHIVKIDIFE
jgi:hypothetical protein